MRHAYLILAHNEFGVLERLVHALDDERNDIFIHIDKRVRTLPFLSRSKGKLVLLQNRIKTYWGDSSLMKAEILLLQTARESGEYAYYHIISGVHFPLKSQDECHGFFDSHYPKSLLMTMETSREEMAYKIGRYHFFVPFLAPKGSFKANIANFLWRGLLYIQKPFPTRNLKGIEVKASQWCSITDGAADYILAHKKEALARFTHTFCCDEYFIPSLLYEGQLAYESVPELMYVRFRRYSPRVLTIDDFSDLMESECLFARKFGAQSLTLINRLEKQ